MTHYTRMSAVRDFDEQRGLGLTRAEARLLGGIVTGDVIRCLVAKTISQQLCEAVERASAIY